jgi:hypothetical protein
MKILLSFAAFVFLVTRGVSGDDVEGVKDVPRTLVDTDLPQEYVDKLAFCAMVQANPETVEIYRKFDLDRNCLTDTKIFSGVKVMFLTF